MLLVKFLRDNKEEAKSGLRKRGFTENDLNLIDEVIDIDDRRKKIQFELDGVLSNIKSLSADIGTLYKTGKVPEANSKKAEVATFKTESERLQRDLKMAQDDLFERLLNIPNIPHNSVPSGTTEEDNEIHRNWTQELPILDASAKPHWELAEEFDIIDFPLGVKITGAGFPVFKGKGARLQRGLINFFLDRATSAGYLEIIPPLVVNEDSARGTGQIPDKEGQMYHIEKDELYLIPTAEVPVTNIYRDVILKESDFPIKMTGYTPCFRREAGAYGKDVRGLNRVHQFDKVEIVQIEHPDNSYDTLMSMLDHVQGLLKELELPYRILKLCGGDLGSASAITYDFEVYSAAQRKWLEVSSVSNFETYQSNRLKLRYKGSDQKNHLAHTLNGSALALARIVAALLENNQTSEGIRIPKAIVPYVGFDLLN
ncbi:MAG: serine--tRNA ligase [Bacteroidia bacterium]|nr:serine--tRNA ligase [Bacteroidia bacterium]